MREYLKTTEEVLREQECTAAGLTSSEVEKRMNRFGPNKLNEGEKESSFKKFLKQLAEPMTIILLVAAVISAGLGIYEGVQAGHMEFPTDVVIILAVVLINAILGVLQENKAEDAIAALQVLSAATSKVLRDGRQVTVKSAELVPGDICILEAGDSVPADMRLIECANLKVEEAALTGEALPVEKTTDVLKGDKVPLGDRRNMVYMGSTAVYGRAVAVVVATGMDTEMGRIAGALSQAKDNQTPLQIKMAQLSKVLTYVVLGICAAIFAVSLLTAGKIDLTTILDTFMIAVSLAVAAIPEGLSTVVTIVLSIGVTNLSKSSAIIRKMTAVETLGCTQIICSDKTGTLTQNRMTVVEHVCEDEALLARALSLCSDSQIDPIEKTAVGEPTENALVNYAYSLGQDKNTEKELYPRVGEVPFDSMRKMMTTLHPMNGKIMQFTKGAPDIILSNCGFHLVNGVKTPLTDADRASIMASNKNMADRALRVLAAACREHDALPGKIDESLETDLTFLGLVGMIDPIRPEVKPAIDSCRAAGIRPIMITGDHKDTAVAIALQLGIVSSTDQAITGAELDEIPDEVFENDVEKYSVYARVQPEHKTRIVNAWQKKGMVTAMTGDGVNDAPSIKNADIGVGMGITGTDVTKNVADMILADDNFATIVSAVGEGRRIYDNIRKAIQFLLTSNLSEVITIFVSTLLGAVIFKAPQLLWINLITDCLPALALGLERGETNIMRRKPRPSREGVFAGGMGAAIAIEGAFISLITIISYYIGRKLSPEIGTTMAFITLSMAEICHCFNMRSLTGSIFRVRNQNWYLWGAAALSLIATLVVTDVPFLAKAFEFAEHIAAPQTLVALAISVTVIPFAEAYKWIRHMIRK